MANTNLEQLIEKIYTTPESGASFTSANKIQEQLIRDHKVHASLKDIQNWLDTNLTYSLHKRALHKFERNPTVVGYIDEQWQIDLLFCPDIKNRFIGACICVDLASRYMWAEPIRNKSGKEIAEVFEKIIQKASPRKPLKLQGDMGKEFFNKNFENVMKKHNIKLFSTHSDHKAAIVERAIRSFKEKLYRILEEKPNETKKWEQLIPKITQAYNDTYHTNIKMAPSQVNSTNIGIVIKNLYGKYWNTNRKQTKNKFNLGDPVRFSSARHVFKKGYKNKWKEEIFRIAKIKYSLPNNLYLLNEWDGTPLAGVFYPYELNKVHVNPESEFRIQKVIARRTNKGKKEIKVRWMGWPPKYDSWLPAEEARDL